MTEKNKQKNKYIIKSGKRSKNLILGMVVTAVANSTDRHHTWR